MTGTLFSSRAETLQYLNLAGKDLHGHALSLAVTDSGTVRLYACLQSLMKMHSTFDEIIAKVDVIWCGRLL